MGTRSGRVGEGGAGGDLTSEDFDAAEASPISRHCCKRIARPHRFPERRRYFRTRETADLFLALIVRLLRPGGRAAVVLPDGSLFGEGVKTRLKEHLMAECNLHTIVRLPNSVFRPYASIGTNLLFFEKGAHRGGAPSATCTPSFACRTPCSRRSPRVRRPTR
jgi:hypothetical protein